MSSDLFIFDNNLEFVPDDPLLFPFCDPSPIDPDPTDTLLPDPADPLSNYSILLSSSPPSHQLQSLSLCHHPNSSESQAAGCGFNCSQEGAGNGGRTQVGYEAFLGPHSYGGHESNVVKYMQRSYSSNSFEEKPLVAAAAALFLPQFDVLVESPEYQGQGMMSSPESNCFLNSQMRRVYSTGDLQRDSLSSHLSTESSFTDEPTLKVGRYSAEERKEKILKYRAKRTQRNFTKTIKYACRKTLADNRPRIRGRFARNDEIGELPKAPPSAGQDDEDDHLWLGLQEEEEEEYGAGRRGPFLGSSLYGETQFHYSLGYNY